MHSICSVRLCIKVQVILIFKNLLKYLHWESCFRCGGRHPSLSCRCKSWVCNSCGKKGHVARVCRSRSSAKSANKHKRQEQREFPGDGSSPEQVHTLFYVKDRPHPPLLITMCFNEVKLRMEVDTGAAVSLISEATYKRLYGLELPDCDPHSNRSRCCCALTLESSCRCWAKLSLTCHRLVRWQASHTPSVNSAWRWAFAFGQRFVFNLDAESRRTFGAAHQEC